MASYSHGSEARYGSIYDQQQEDWEEEIGAVRLDAWYKLLEEVQWYFDADSAREFEYTFSAENIKDKYSLERQELAERRRVARVDTGLNALSKAADVRREKAAAESDIPVRRPY